MIAIPYRDKWLIMFPISRDPPEGGTKIHMQPIKGGIRCFQFLGIPPKGEPIRIAVPKGMGVSSFQFLGIPPKGEQVPYQPLSGVGCWRFVSNF